MKINPIFSLWSTNGAQRVNNHHNYVQNPIVNNNQNDIFVKSADNVVRPKQINFMGYDVILVDGGNHLKDMTHFAEAISKDFNITVYSGDDTPESKYNKPLKNIEEQLKIINRYKMSNESTYVAIPVSMTVSLQNLAEQYKQVMGSYIHLKPHTVQTQKEKLIKFLKVLYEHPNEHRKYIKYMDPKNEGLEYVYGIIQEINKLNCKKVYVPVSPPIHKTLKYMAEERGQTPELTNYLATGYDEDGKVKNIADYIKSRDWYDFNLLALSNANVVNIKNMQGYDNIYSAYDTTIKDGARGVYNFTPIRENGKIVGYSFNDVKTNEYPFEEFPYNDEVQEIAQFVGLKTKDVVADDEKTERFRKALKENNVTEEFSDKLYPVWKLFTEKELRDNKIFARGDFVDYQLKHFYRRNRDYEIIYPAADCEMSGRPSVMGMWGGSYAMFSAIERDVSRNRFLDALKLDNINIMRAIVNRLENAVRCNQDYAACENYLTPSMEYIDIMGGLDRNNSFHMQTYRLMADAKYHNGDFVNANIIYNAYLNNFCKNYFDIVAECGPHGLSKSGYSADSYRRQIVEMFEILSDIADKRGEFYPAQYCRRAAIEIKNGTKIGEAVLRRRANDDINLGDLFG